MYLQVTNQHYVKDQSSHLHISHLIVNDDAMMVITLQIVSTTFHMLQLLNAAVIPDKKR